MDTPQDPGSVDLLRMGPIKVVEVFTSPSPSDRPVTDRIGYETVPFAEIKHLCSRKPLSRFDPLKRDC